MLKKGRKNPNWSTVPTSYAQTAEAEQLIGARTFCGARTFYGVPVHVLGTVHSVCGRNLRVFGSGRRSA